ncbi:LOW QUALITY PROTEIN: uncharacterized protein LOC111076816 [Drosophila obscura]|uniref:LOW QUALITY PROTEIN: uncharacterized protein LOC111076816 n=1 Tax=Drosophila obscura TaxID=7282 RepID=UPI001BB1CB56|nr:LOW QUALITY PROTEIN: uncharacterized protein LOC111076816 [Drosophila obscura]
MILQQSCPTLLLFLITQGDLIGSVELTHIIDTLNDHLRISTNILYCNERSKLINYESEYLRQAEITRLIYTSAAAINSSHLQLHIGHGSQLFIVFTTEPPYDLFPVLDLHFQNADFLIVIDKSIDLDTWLAYVQYAFELGYVRLLLYTTPNGAVYGKMLFPVVRIVPATVEQYLHMRDTLKDLHGYPVRVAAYKNVPRSFMYLNSWGRMIYAGFYMRFVRAFLHSRNATFVPVHTPNDSPGNCTLALKNESVDLCADSLAANQEMFSLTYGFRIAYANVMVAHAKPLLSYRYLEAPFQNSVWMCLVIYVLLIVSFLSCIHWQQHGRWDFSKYLLEVFSSLLFSGFNLRSIRGRERYILFGVIFMTGFVYSTMYLGLLKSMLISEVFEPQINTFEQLVASNITLLVDPYDRILFAKYNMPEVLWSVVQTVSFETLLHHRNRFDQSYAYVLFTDRMALYETAQLFLRHPRLRRIPINFAFLFTGIPMRKKWFLKEHLSRAWYHSFESGLTRKLAVEANNEAMSVGHLHYLITEHMEAKPLDLDYFVMPTIALLLGCGLAIISFVIELTAWRMCGSRVRRC